jgi:hypothetical protein
MKKNKTVQIGKIQGDDITTVYGIERFEGSNILIF